ncbi:class II fructose-1,6-bisphosphate aldolase [Fusobacterium ulcerans]|jgi:fructose-bisphosphate aldolase class II|uniref:Ketose-bisphosphate aldolase n=1 Tax=Fusobacterium ulcerans 12-1B TaxID=457404 RepID=H1PWZ9_9FUSO|nr:MULTISPECIES: ketose-bisphosphate aldolase [Fusobacterium]EHO78815.1 ketose-bisphosphate aldolase [Fusobacterium ulcerans 12-1B]MDH6458986.1 fructose-bisphosphate aldolase class II [Fusobacterium sp. PH5-7]RGY63214.1 ketose-bisphosphate aldolase [Fusobacterium ulcerans]HJH07304.1 ketose-bisphosphate aldolase [Fusobacterium ulcerans]
MKKYSFKELGLENTRDMFKRANENGYSIPAFNFANLEQLQAILDACTEAESDVIIQISASARTYIGKEQLPLLVKGAIDEIRAKGSKIAVALNLDHGKGHELIKDCLDYGFSSVMIDASKYDFEKNIELTKEIVELAKDYDASVEGEIGVIHGTEDEHSADESAFTKPAEAVEFIKRTGVDSLAIAIGTAHGAHKFKVGEDPKLRLDILEAIKKEIGSFPIVLHGSSSVPQDYIKKFKEFGGEVKDAIGIPDEELKKASKSIVTKINVDTDGRLVFTSALREYFAKNPKEMDLKKYLDYARNEMKNFYVKKINSVFKTK